MRKIEQRMVNAINNKVNYRESNTEVIIKGANVFVRLYDTYIYAFDDAKYSGASDVEADSYARKQMMYWSPNGMYI